MPSMRRPSGRSTLRTCCTARSSCSARPMRCTRERISAPTSSSKSGRYAPRARSTRSPTWCSSSRRSSPSCWWAGRRAITRTRSTRPPSRRRGGRSCGPTRWWCRSRACSCSSRGCPRRSRACGRRAPASSSSIRRRSRYETGAQSFRLTPMTGLTLLGMVMLVFMIFAIFIGFPISFTLLFLALTFGYFGLGHVVFDLAYFQTIGMMKEELLAAVPLFIFMGFITEQAGLMERLFSAFRMLLAPVRGALFLVVIVTSTVFAMATGIVGAAVTVLGIMASPIMIKTGYDGRLSAGAITAGGTLGILIPPSVMLIVMGPVLGVSVADLYAAAFGPGFLLAGLYLAYLAGRAFINPKLGPPVPKEERVQSLYVMLREVVIGVVPLLGLIAATLGSILAGLATPTEASGIGSLGALILAACYRRLTVAGLRRAVLSATATSSMVLLLAVTSNIFGAVFARLGTANWITETLLSMPVPPVLMLVFVVVLIFLLGWPFEWPAVILVFLPIFYPVMDGLKPVLATSLDIPVDMLMVWFGTLVAVTLQTAYLSPPVAMSAYYLRQVVKEWSLLTIYKGMFEFMMLQIIAITLIVIFPSIAVWFPERLQAESRAVITEEVEGGASLEEEGGYGAQLREALEGDEEEAAPEGQEEEESAGDSLEKDELSNTKKK